ncbi:hypothetical protein VTN77DRAFT_6883 [Rasamsonia byssochlamydoides]|uniref:uncharacterized protein n=1 Tax=Rasamsonia byssochlamydoides TaxID=89139 RepID=UPI00374260EE
MSSTNRCRVTKRMHQACENCRRKKTRCPGERPACSTCTRLFQACHYSSGNAVFCRTQSNGQDLETRLAQLEEKMELMLERAIPEPASQAETPKSYTGAPSSQTTPVEDAVRPPALSSSLLPPKDVLAEAVDLYFRYCHKQPLWLFNRDELLAPEECCEEVIFAILALTVRFSNRPFFKGQSEQLAQRYAEASRGLIIAKIAQGTVQLSTIQSLCLLAFANFVAKDTHLAWLHISLATSLSRCAGLDVESNRGECTSTAEARRRVFWSIHLLNQIYGQRGMMLNMLEDIHNPKYVGACRDLQQEMGMTPPLTPQEESFDNVRTQNDGIWTYMVQLATLWREVRNYVSYCADGSTKPPWSPDSGYTVIGAHLMNLETKFPTFHRYDAVRFWDRSSEELQRNRDYWSPWLYLQFTYHAVHSMLNHPFLYSSRPQQSAQLAVPNTFWKTSSELALIHTTWTVRLIDMVSEKDYRVTDPFLGHCAAIAATIHLYYCRAADSRVRETAQNKLAKCMKFLGELAAVWPVCQLIYERLDKLVQSALSSNPQLPGEPESAPRTVSINTALMWDILDYTCPNASARKPGRGLFHPSLCPEPDPEEDDAEDHTVETQIFHHPTTEVDTSNGGQELPPFSDRRTRTRTRDARGRGHSEPVTAVAAAAIEDRQPQQHPETATWPGPGIMGNCSFMDVTHDPFFQFQDQGSPYLGLWGIGNL